MKLPSLLTSPALLIVAGLTLVLAWSLSCGDTVLGPTSAAAQEHGQAAAHDEGEAAHNDDAQGDDAHSDTAHNDTAHNDDAQGHEEHVDPVGKLPLWTAIPFLGILLSIALGPLVAPHWWHRNFPKASAFWALAFAIPFLIALKTDALQSILHIYLIDYFPFIILLWALFTIAGGIYVGGALRGSPWVNVALLFIGTAIASWIGTTGAAMVMIRPLLRANAWRVRKVHVVVFFIFLVANIGGSLTPLGDPPLFLGFIHNVPFFWVTSSMLPLMAVAVVILLVMFFLIDSYYYRKEEKRPQSDPDQRGLYVEGYHNFLFLLGVMAAVIFSGSVELRSIPIYGHVTVELQNLIRDGLLIMLGLLSLQTTVRSTREKNEFSWFPIKEVAYLFAGIFMTIIPALAILKAGPDGALAALTTAVDTAVDYFWATGILSSFLDNAPTYLTFFNAALGNLGAAEEAVPAMLGYVDGVAKNADFVRTLTAISAGAVFMGANTYIGNAPNFMVKSIAEEAGVPMPSFFGYLVKYSLPILIPVFVIVTLIFFL